MVTVDSLSLIAELAVGLVAAAGIVVAIGGRDRDYNPLDRSRIRSLVFVSATPLALALFCLTLLSAEVPPARAWSIVSFAYIALAAGRIASTAPEFFRVQDAPWSSAGVLLAISASVMLLLLYNALTMAAFWPILAACSFELLMAVLLVLRLLLGSR